VLAGLAALAALAVIGQAMARQTSTERADHHALSALGVRPREFMLAALLRALMIGAAGATGAVLVTVLASPLTPVGEARLADPSPGGMSVDPVVLPLGALAVLAAVTAVSAWPAVRHARLLSNRPPPGPAPALVHSAGRAAALAGLPATAVIGIRRALDRGRGGQPVGTALLGTVMAVAALCATAVFGASLTHLISTPALYGAPFQAYFSGDGEPGSAPADRPGRRLLRRGDRRADGGAAHRGRPGAAVRASPGAVCGLPGPGPAGAAALAQTRRPHAR
jgi:hypothetical protein